MQTSTSLKLARTPRSLPCDTWTDHEWSDPIVQASGYVPRQGWFRRELQTCRRCGRRVLQDRWTPIEPRTLATGSDRLE